jgi:hypothetical protein
MRLLLVLATENTGICTFYPTSFPLRKTLYIAPNQRYASGSTTNHWFSNKSQLNNDFQT